MQKKLLNKNNLIIVIVILTLFLISIPNITFAATSLSDYLQETIAMWYYFIKYFCIIVLFLLAIVTLFKAVFSNLAEDKALLKEVLPYFIIGALLLLFLENIIAFIIYIEQMIVDKLQTIGYDLAGISVDSEVTSLYEATRTKAYEIKFSSGMLGTLMYVVLVFYTFKFFVIYVKRYVNVMILILVAPIVVLLYTYRRTVQGRGGLIGRWVKEFIFNVFIQVIHALVYSTVVAYALSLSNNVFSFLGAIIAFLAFFFMFKINGYIRKIFNFVGGKNTVYVKDHTSSIKQPIRKVGTDLLDDPEGFVKGARENVTKVVSDFTGTVKGFASDRINMAKSDISQSVRDKIDSVSKSVKEFAPNSIKEKATNIAKELPGKAGELLDTIDGKNVIISAEDIEKEQEKIDNPNLVGKVYNTIQGAVLGVTSKAITGIENTAKKTKEKILNSELINILNQDSEMVKRFSRILKSYGVRKDIEKRAENNEEQSIEELLEAFSIDVLASSQAREALLLKSAITGEDIDIVAAVYGVYGASVFLYKNVGSTYMGMLILASAKYEKKYLENETKESENKQMAIPSKTKTSAKTNSQKPIRLKKVNKRANKKKYKFKRFNSGAIRTIIHHLNRRYVMNNRYLLSLYKVDQMVKSGNLQVRGYYRPQGALGTKTVAIRYTAKLSSEITDKTTVDVTLASAGNIPVRLRNRTAKTQLENYHNLIENSQRAMFSGIAMDIAGIQDQRIVKSVQAIRQQSASSLYLQKMTDMGEAMQIGDGLYVTFSNQNQYMSEVETKRKVMDSVIIDSVIKFDVPIEEINFSENQEMQNEIFTQLAQRGVVSFNDTANEEGRKSIIDSLNQRKEDILNNKEDYNNSILKKLAASAFVKAVDTGEEIADKVTGFGNSVKEVAQNNKAINNKYTRLLADMSIKSTRVLTQIAQGTIEGTIEYEIENAKQGLNNIVQEAEQYIDSAKEMYGVSKDDFENKGRQIKKDAEKKVKELAKKAVEPFRIFPLDDESDNKEVFIFSIGGAVVAPAKYRIKLKTLEEKIGKKIYSVDTEDFTVEDAIKIAGGITEDADLTAIPYNQSIKNKSGVNIPRRTVYEDTEDNENNEEILMECKTVVDKVIKDYIEENEIKDVETLRKLVHKKSIISKAKRELSEKAISSKEIESLFEKRLKEIKFIRDCLNNVSKEMKVVDENELQVSEESVESDIARQEMAAKNSQEASIDAALKRLNKMSEAGSTDENTENEKEEEVSGENEELKRLLLQLEDQREKVLVPIENKQERNKKENVISAYMVDPDLLTNKILRRI